MPQPSLDQISTSNDKAELQDARLRLLLVLQAVYNRVEGLHDAWQCLSSPDEFIARSRAFDCMARIVDRPIDEITQYIIENGLHPQYVKSWNGSIDLFVHSAHRTAHAVCKHYLGYVPLHTSNFAWCEFRPAAQVERHEHDRVLSELKMVKALLAHQELRAGLAEESRDRLRAQLDALMEKPRESTQPPVIFVERPTAPPPDDNDMLSTQGRKSALVIIAALAGEAKLDVATPSKTGEVIAKLAANIGCAVSGRAVANWLRDIPAVIKERSKN